MPGDWRLFRPRFKEIWRIDVTYLDSEGHEQEGERPCIVIKDFEEAEMVLIIPLTSSLSISRLPYAQIIRRNNVNNLSDDSIALIFQIRSISKSRLKHHIGRLTNENYNKIKLIIKQFFKI